MSTTHRPRRKRAKGTWMRQRDPELTLQWMEKKDFSQARLARYADCSRQFIHLLVTGKRRTCTPPIARRIEEALGVVSGTLFVDEKSPTSKPSVSRKRTAKVEVAA